MATKEYYRPQPMAADSSYAAKSSHIAGFLASAAGTITITSAAPAPDNIVFVNALPLAVGFNRIPILLNTSEGAIVQLAGGAAGSLLL